jgi:hypothetical protein
MDISGIKPKTNRYNKNQVRFLTYEVMLQSSNAFGGIQASMGVPPQLVAISPIGQPPNAG